MKRLITLTLILAMLGLGSYTTPNTNLYEVRVQVRSGSCTQTKRLTIEARSQNEARSRAIRAARSSVQISVNGVYNRR